MGAKAPSGTVTFVFSDIEGSTQRWDANRDAMQEAVRRHDAIMRDHIESNDGFIFKTIGDAFCAAFPSSERALTATLAVQRAIGREDWTAVGGLRVRMAIHTGIADERDDDYFGPTVNRVARLLAIGHGGQILLSHAARALIEERLFPELRLLDLGMHHLKDLTTPERVYQLCAEGLVADFPPVRSIGSESDSLSGSAAVSFVGRERDVAAILDLGTRCRVITITGPGGMGKTRTALHVAGKIFGENRTVTLAELGPLTGASPLASTIAGAADVTLAGSGDVAKTLAHALADRPRTLILDNCEHVIEDIARLSAFLLRECQQLRLLATSRQALGIEGESVYRLQPMENADAVALFVKRAQALDSRFKLASEDEPLAIEICQRLDGIPLAIELAAARTNVLNLRQLLGRLEARFRVLVGSSRDKPDRQRTLHAAIDWSHDLLDVREKLLFRRTGVFANGFTLEAASEVCSDESLDPEEVFDVLASLVDKSLVVSDFGRAEPRFRLLESTRAYAREKMVEANELQTFKERHLSYMARTFAKAGGEHEATMAGRILDGLADDLEDARSALDFAEESGTITQAVDLFVCTRLWDHLGLHREAIERAEAYATLLGGTELTRQAQLFDVVALCRLRMGDTAEALEAASRAVDLSRASGDATVLADALLRFGLAMYGRRRFDDGMAALAESEAVVTPTPRRRYQLLAARNAIATVAGDVDAAIRYRDEMRLLGQSIGNPLIQITNALNSAEFEHLRGNTYRAIEIVREHLELASQLPDRGVQEAHLQCNLAGYLAAVNDTPSAGKAARAAIVLYAGRDERGAYTAIGLEHFALICALEGDLRRAAAIEGYAAESLARHGFEREYTEQTTYDRLQKLLSDGLDVEERNGLLAQGAQSRASEVVASVLGRTA